MPTPFEIVGGVGAVLGFFFTLLVCESAIRALLTSDGGERE